MKKKHCKGGGGSQYLHVQDRYGTASKKSASIEHNVHFIIQILYHGCWWRHGDIKISHGIKLVISSLLRITGYLWISRRYVAAWLADSLHRELVMHDYISEIYCCPQRIDCYRSWNGIYCSDVIMSAMVSQITGVSTVYLTGRSDADQRKHQSSASLAIPHAKGQ